MNILTSLTGLLDEGDEAANCSVILKQCEELYDSLLSLNDRQCTLVEKHTREQAKSRLWFQICAGCMTTSKLHQVCHTNPVQPALSLIAGMCSQNTNCRLTQAKQ